jgi:acylphosphatase
VGFREFVRGEASQRGLTGYVRNGDDGRSVEVIAEGDEMVVTGFVECLNKGPRFAHVDHVDFTLSDASHAFGRFSVEM